MGASKNFFTELREGEQFVNVTMKDSVYLDLCNAYEIERDFTINYRKQKNEKYNENESLQNLYKLKSKLSKEITEMEQKINHVE